MTKARLTCTLFAALFLVVCGCEDSNDQSDRRSRIHKTPKLGFDYGDSYPHDITSFTEGLLVHKGVLYESTGATPERPQTRSLFGALDLETGTIDVKVELDRSRYFGEGIAFLNDKVYQLTYKSRIGFIYDQNTFAKISEFEIPSKEGWGITTDGKLLIMSDGTSTLTYLDPDNLKTIKLLHVTEYGRSKKWLNELEYINGFIYANVLNTTIVVKIDPSTGNVVGQIDFISLAQEAKSNHPGSLEMNGIAYDSLSGDFYVTGKLWPKIYKVSLGADESN